jgi:hypothetical protein
MCAGRPFPVHPIAPGQPHVLIAPKFVSYYYPPHASHFSQTRPMSIPFVACMIAAASLYHLPPRVLPSIQAVEGGQAGLVKFNQNGSADLGPMQVNTIWVRPLASYAGMTQDVVVTRLINDPCFNIEAAAAIMRVYLTEAHGDLMVAIGFYHSHTPERGSAYQAKVTAAAGALFEARRTRPAEE